MKIPNVPKFKQQENILLPASECLAKTWRGQRGMNIFDHLRLCGLVLRQLRNIYRDSPRGELLPIVAEYLAALHDIGKVTPDFQSKIYAAIGEKLKLGPVLTSFSHAEHSGWFLREKYGEKFAALAAAHHGKNCDLGNSDNNNLMSHGGTAWKKLRERIMEDVLESISLDPDKLPEIPDSVDDIISGAVIIADWISSAIDEPDGSSINEDDIARLVASAGFSSADIKKGMSFEDIFGFQPNELQIHCSEKIPIGTISVIESEMGSGKTEAALYAAYKMLEAGEANGIYFALPTRLTSEKIYGRLNNFLSNILAGEKKEALLIHGDSYLNWNLTENSGEDDLSANRDSWFQNKKRALLAPFGVGTVDQALLSILNVKHNAVRSLGLSGKVIIIDECHSYDNYTGYLLKKLIRRLREYNCTVIILSATLTDKARHDFALLEGWTPKPDLPYPLLTRNVESEGAKQICFTGSSPCQVNVVFSDEQRAASVALEKVANGEQVLWIENTVDRAQKIFSQFATLIDTEHVGLIHSKFPRCMRGINEDHWVEMLGKNGAAARVSKGRILIGTQVLEQSVDIDADYLITRLAPIDMFLQRIGRLWRHRSLDKIRPESAERSVMVLTDGEFIQPDKIISDTFLPYDAYYICRTFEVIKERDSIVLPGDIRHLLEAVYLERHESGFMQRLKQNLASKIEAMENLAKLASSKYDKPANDDNFSTRINDRPSVQLLLLKKNNCGNSLKEFIHSPFMDEPIVLSSGDRLNISKQIMRTMITVPENNSAMPYENFTAEFLSPFVYIGDNEYHPVRVAYVDTDGTLLDRVGNPLPFIWHPLIGLKKNSKKY